MSLDEKIELTIETIKRIDLYITSTNFKAALHLTFLTAILSAILFFIYNLNCKSCVDGNIIGVVNFLAVVISTISLISSTYFIRSVVPRMDTYEIHPSIFYFKDISEYKSAEEFQKEIAKRDGCDIQKDLAYQAYYLSNILQKKMENIAKGTKLIEFLIIPYVVLLVFSVLALS